MRFAGEQTKLTIKIVSGPDNEGWCKLSVMLEDEYGTWQSPSAPCIMFSELKALSDFFNVIEESDQEGAIDFIEPALAFRCENENFNVILSYEFYPSWADKSEDAFVVSLPISKKSLKYSRNYLEQYINEYED